MSWSRRANRNSTIIDTETFTSSKLLTQDNRLEMPIEHYVPRSYLQHFAPDNEGLISQYSLVDKHGGGDYYPPRDRYPVKKAGAVEGLADGWFENPETTDVEREMIWTLRKILSDENLDEEDIGRISQFMAFQNSRTPASILHYEARQNLPVPVPGDDFHEQPQYFDEYWKNALYHNANDGHETLQFMGWLVVENETDVPFITSDKPVAHSFLQDFDEVSSTNMEMHGREMFCPLDPDHLLLFLDPEAFQIESQWPQTKITRKAVTDRREIHKFNLLQGVHAFQEVFGPVGKGDYLEDIIQTLCRNFPHEDFIRGNRGDLETLRKAQELATGMSSKEEIELYHEKYKSIVRSRRLKSHAVWVFNHDLELVADLVREDPRDDFWEDLWENPQ